MSDGNGYWTNLRNADETTYKQAVKIRRLRENVMKCEQAIKFLCKCRDANIQPMFTRWKNTRDKDHKTKKRYRRKILLDEIKSKHDKLRTLKGNLSNEEQLLYTGMTFLRKTSLKYSINCIVSKLTSTVVKRQEKKFDKLLAEKRSEEGTRQNPRKTIWNLSTRTLSNEEYKLLQYGLNHGLAMQPVDNHLMASAESLWDQIERSKICKENIHDIRKAKNYIRAMTFNLINLNDKQIFADKKKIKMIQDLRKHVVIVKPDKGSGIVLLDIEAYNTSLMHLFSDSAKFKPITHDPTNSRLVAYKIIYLNCLIMARYQKKHTKKYAQRVHTLPARTERPKYTNRLPPYHLSDLL